MIRADYFSREISMVVCARLAEPFCMAYRVAAETGAGLRWLNLAQKASQ
jgi:hypothetical protein